jgi:glucose/arabinose dehydrogenase
MVTVWQVQEWPVLNRHFRIVSCVFSLAILVSAMTSADTAQAQDAAFDPSAFSVALEPVASGLDEPVYITGPDDGSGRLFVVERPGTIRIIRDGEVQEEPFLDITDLVESGYSEQGLLSVAFPDDFAETGEFCVYYTARPAGEGVGNNTVARFQVTADDPDLADPASGEILLSLPDGRVNHNGGQLQFGPDGYLYVSLGDGGGGGDPDGNGQNPATLFGSILRIDPGSEIEPYGIPPDNPFADGGDGAPEVWAFGLRNPWRFSFDRETGDLFIGDVGQGAIEEVDWLPAGSEGGTNFGWNIMEGSTCYAADDCDTTGLTWPTAEYTHDYGCSVVGGFVYRSTQAPSLEGVYLFADYCTGLLWGMGRDADGNWVTSDPIETGLNISSFGEDADGEVYVAALSGDIFRVGA